MLRSSHLCAATFGSLLFLTAPAFAVPEIQNVSLRGLQTGATTSLVIDGADLLPEPRLLLPVPVAKQTVGPNATPNRVQIDVTLAVTVPPGLYPLRIANAKGVSRPVLVGIDDLSQQPFAPTLAKLPAALHGNLAGSATLRTELAGKKGQKVVVEIEAVRLGSAIDPVLELQDSRRVPLTVSQSTALLAGDARLEAVLPADGQYAVELRDALYRAGNPNHFRLKIGDLHYVDLVYPLGGQRGTKVTLQPIGNLPLDTRLNADLSGTTGDVAAPLPKLSGLTGPAPAVLVGDFPEVLETEPPAGKLQEVPVPAVINGRLGKPHEEDRYRLLVQPGMSLRFDMIANRAGSPVDGVLTLYNEAGAVLASSDDRPDSVDPTFEFTVPEKVTALVLGLTDETGRGGPNYLYRVAVTPANRPEFDLTVLDDRLVVPQAGSAVVRIRANRVRYGGPITLSVAGAPQGVTLTGDVIPPGVTDTLLTLTAPPGTPVTQLLAGIQGNGFQDGLSVKRTALLAASDLTRNRPWMRSDLGFAVTAPAPVSVAWDTSDVVLSLGTPFAAKVKVNRAAGVAGPVRLSLLTSQIVPRTPDNRAEDVNRAIRLEGAATIAGDQTAGAAKVLVPANLLKVPYDLLVRAELLSADGKQVVASAVTPSRRVQVSDPFALVLAGPPAVETRSGAGPAAKLAGKVLRVAGFDKPVTVTLAGLPPELPAPSVQVAADRSDFELNLAFPAGNKVGDIPNVRLVATSQITPQQTVRSNEIPVALKVVKAELPPAGEKK